MENKKLRKANLEESPLTYFVLLSFLLQLFYPVFLVEFLKNFRICHSLKKLIYTSLSFVDRRTKTECAIFLLFYIR